MKTATFTAYARMTGYDSPQLNSLGIRLDHVFVVSSLQNNWNCFGGGIEEACDNHKIASSPGYVEWARLVYGPENEGKGGRPPNAFPAADVTELFNGVCQNAANRILALTEYNLDVRKANGNALVTLLYGKYGFGINVFIEKIKAAASLCGASEDELKMILNRFEQGQSAEAELDILRNIYTLRLGRPFPEIPAEQWSRMVQNHSVFQLRRTVEFNRLACDQSGHDIREDLVIALRPDLERYYNELENVFGRAAVLQIMQVLPSNIALAMKAFDGSR